MTKKNLVFNWKMNPSSLKEARKLAKFTQNYAKKIKNNVEIIIAPPFIFTEEIGKILKKAKLGAQDVFWKNPPTGGAYTGEISANELKKLGVKYIIVGHSERRQILGETDKIINKKVLTALKAGLKIILCVGELKRDIKNKKYDLINTKKYIKNQLKKDLKNISTIYNLKSTNLIIAYEPVWAIGTGHNDTPENVAEIINFIKQTLLANGYALNSKVLYGGSVNSKNIKNFVKYKEIDGFLIGEAGLQTKEIKNIIKTI